MSILKVARMGHPVLRSKARAIEPGEIKGATIQRLIDDMLETMTEYHGVGLAAPQVHQSVRLFVGQLDAREDVESTPRSQLPSSIQKSSRLGRRWSRIGKAA